MSDTPQIQHSILPEGRRGPLSNDALVWVIATMCLLAALTLGAFVAVANATSSWTSSLTSSVTVQIKPDTSGNVDTLTEQALALLKADPVVLSTRTVSSEQSKALLEPWLGDLDLLNDLPLPVLIAVDIDQSAATDLSGLSEALADLSENISLDDHRRWNDRLVRMAGTIEWLGFSVLIFILAATATIVVFATRAGLSANHEVVEVLHLIGAKDNFIAHQFERYFFGVALRAGLIGVGGAAIAFLIVAQTGQSDWTGDSGALLPSLAFDASFYPLLVMIPIATIVVSVLTARFTVLRTLRESP